MNIMYRNPILYSDYSDPDVIRIDDDFFMVASSFTYFPGLPLLHSKDLVHWRIINNIAKELPFEAYNHTMHRKGLWAPSIRYHEGKFYVYVCTPDEGLFLFTAVDPYGDWIIHHVKRVVGWIDPCPLWDYDGKAYLLHAFAGSRVGINSILYLHCMSPDGLEILDNGRLVFDGGEENHTTEGPKLYKKNGYYYIFAPAGGVEKGWQLALRAKNINGPYEVKKVLHQGNSVINGPHQGGYIDISKESGWFLHFQDMGPYGRIPHLQPVRWKEDWPCIGEDMNKDGIGEPMLSYQIPEVIDTDFLDKEKIQSNKRRYGITLLPDISDDFKSEVLGLQWQWQANPQKAWYSLADKPGNLRLFCARSERSHTLFHAPWFLSHLMQSRSFFVDTKVTLQEEDDADRAGIAMMGYTYSYIAIHSKSVKDENENEYKKYYLSYFVGKTHEVSYFEEQSVWENCDAHIYLQSNTVYLRMVVNDGAIVNYYYSENGREYIQISVPFQAVAGGWTGARPGIFSGNFMGRISQGYADFHYYCIKNCNCSEPCKFDQDMR